MIIFVLNKMHYNFHFGLSNDRQRHLLPWRTCELVVLKFLNLICEAGEVFLPLAKNILLSHQIEDV